MLPHQRFPSPFGALSSFPAGQQNELSSPQQHQPHLGVVSTSNSSEFVSMPAPPPPPTPPQHKRKDSDVRDLTALLGRRKNNSAATKQNERNVKRERDDDDTKYVKDDDDVDQRSPPPQPPFTVCSTDPTQSRLLPRTPPRVDVVTCGPDAFSLSTLTAPRNYNNTPHTRVPAAPRHYDHSEGNNDGDDSNGLSAALASSSSTTLIDRLRDVQRQLTESQIQSSRADIEAQAKARHRALQQKYAIENAQKGKTPHKPTTTGTNSQQRRAPVPPPPSSAQSSQQSRSIARDNNTVLNRLLQSGADDVKDERNTSPPSQQQQQLQPNLLSVRTLSPPPSAPTPKRTKLFASSSVTSTPKPMTANSATPDQTSASASDVGARNVSPPTRRRGVGRSSTEQATPSSTSSPFSPTTLSYSPNELWNALKSDVLSLGASTEQQQNPYRLAVAVLSGPTANSFSFPKTQKTAVRTLGDSKEPKDSFKSVTHIAFLLSKPNAEGTTGGRPSLVVCPPTAEIWEFIAEALFLPSTVLQLITFHSGSILIPLFVFLNTKKRQFELDGQRADGTDRKPLPAYVSAQSASQQTSEDVRVMAWMLEPHNQFPDFDFLCAEHSVPMPESLSSVNSADGALARLPLLLQLHSMLEGKLKEAQLLISFQRVERHINFLCCLMKVNGFFIDTAVLSRQCQSVREEMESLKSHAVRLAGEDFNIQSPEDIRRILFDVLRLPPPAGASGTTKTGKVSTSEETLRALSSFHELPNVIITYRKHAKLLQTYIEGILGASYPTLQRDDSSTMNVIHANFLQDGTDTGRLSCTEPNLQNLPRAITTAQQQQGDKEEAEAMMGRVRNAFVAPPDCELLALDYEQIELRVVAHFSQDENLFSALTSGGDIHTEIAARLFQKEGNNSSVTKEERQLGKRIVYGVLYGMGPQALAKQLPPDLSCSVDDAARFIQRFRSTFSSVAPFMNKVVEDCRGSKFVRTLFHRWRQLPDIMSTDSTKRSYAERQAVNTVIQGTAADIVKCAMLAVHAEIVKLYPVGAVELICQVHDELVFVVDPRKLRTDVANEQLSADDLIVGVGRRMKQVMESVVKLRVPLVVNATRGTSFGERVKI
eukprot:PhM_4_TR8441/c0_g1_i1/m.51251/K02335/DPO1, polA; DNA polymerase I